MQTEEFKTELEFREKFPSGLYLCPNCGILTTNKFYCQNCGCQANGLFGTMNKGYKYKIGEESEQEIFMPVELFDRWKQNENSNNKK